MSIDALSSQLVRMIDDHLDVIIRDTNSIAGSVNPNFGPEYKQAAYKAVIERLKERLSSEATHCEQ